MSGQSTPIEAVIETLTQGLARPGQLWALGVIGLSLLLGYAVTRVLLRRSRRRLDAEQASGVSSDDLRAHALQFSIDGVRRLAFPLSVPLFLWVGEAALRSARLIGATDARLLRLVMTLLLAMALIRLAVYVLRRVFRDAQWLVAWERLIAGFVWAVVALHVTGLLEDTIHWLAATTLPLGAARVSLWAVLTGGVSVIVTLLAALWLGSSLEERLMRAHSVDANVRAVLSRVLRALLVLVSVLVALSLVGIDLTVLSVFGGALGVGLGLGLQRIASNYVAGFIILLDRSIRIGDQVAVDRFSGTVARIETRYTVLRAVDGSEAIVPNELLVATPVNNQTLADKKQRLMLRLVLAHGTDLAPLLPQLQAQALAQPGVLAVPLPQAVLLGFVPGGLEVELAFSVQEPDGARRQAIQSQVAQALILTLNAHGASFAPAPPEAAAQRSRAA
jgi:small-conductance mechanosensitive channel